MNSIQLLLEVEFKYFWLCRIGSIRIEFWIDQNRVGVIKSRNLMQLLLEVEFQNFWLCRIGSIWIELELSDQLCSNNESNIRYEVPKRWNKLSKKYMITTKSFEPDRFQFNFQCLVLVSSTVDFFFNQWFNPIRSYLWICN